MARMFAGALWGELMRHRSAVDGCPVSHTALIWRPRKSSPLNMLHERSKMPYDIGTPHSSKQSKQFPACEAAVRWTSSIQLPRPAPRSATQGHQHQMEFDTDHVEHYCGPARSGRIARQWSHNAKLSWLPTPCGISTLVWGTWLGRAPGQCP